MKPKLTSLEREQLTRLLAIVQDESRPISERAIAKAKFVEIYEKALKRTIAKSNQRDLAYA